MTAAGEDPAVVLALLRAIRARVGGRAGDAPPRGGAPLHLRGEALARADDHVRRATQSGVLAALAHAEDPATLRALAHAADVVAQSSSTTSTPWDELLPSLSEAASSPRDAHREAASLLLGNLAESMGAHLATHHGALVATLVAASEIESDDASTRNGAVSETAARRRARRAALGALAQLASALGTSGDFEKVATLVPRIVERCLRAAAEYSEPSLFEKTDAARLPDFRGVAAALPRRRRGGRRRRGRGVRPRPASTPARGGDGAGGGDDRARGTAWDHERYGPPSVPETRRWTTRAPPPSRRWRRWRPPTPERWTSPSRRRRRRRRRRARPRRTRRAPSRRCSCRPLCAAARGEDGFHRDANDTNDANDDSETRGVAAAARAALRQCALRFPPSVTLPHAIGPVADAGARGAAPSAGALAAFAAVVEGCAHDAVDDDARAKHVLAALQLGVQSGDAATARAAARAAAELTEHAGHALASLHGEARARAMLCVAVRAAAAAESSSGGDAGDDGDGAEGFAAPAQAVAFVENCGDEELYSGDAPRRASPPRWWAARAPRRARARARGASRRRSPRWSPRQPLGSRRTRARRSRRWRRSPARRESPRAKRRRTHYIAALAAMASVVAATGAEHGFVDAILDAATRRLSDASTDSTSVSRECALRCFARLAAALDRRLAPWLPGATAAAVSALASAVRRPRRRPAAPRPIRRDHRRRRRGGGCRGDARRARQLPRRRRRAGDRRRGARGAHRRRGRRGARAADAAHRRSPRAGVFHAPGGRGRGGARGGARGGGRALR